MATFVTFPRKRCLSASAAMKNVFRGRRQRGFESFGRAPAPISLALTGPQWIGLHVWGRAPHVRQANPVGGCPPQFAHRVVSRDGETPKMVASRSTSGLVNPRCLPLRRPSAAHTVELLIIWIERR